VDIVDRILNHLEANGVTFRRLQHEATRTSEDSARVRGEPLSVGAKAIVMRLDDSFALFVTSAVRKIDSARLRKHFGVKKLRFATPEELHEHTGLVPGSVPPFGQPILAMPLFVDPSVLENERIAFNAGSLTESIIMSADDYERVCNGTVLAFTKEADDA
jgi:prolyl-tRNA editing enzyme YbaK/EbsC (Cys-tRNA(Pro) deacylase)